MNNEKQMIESYNLFNFRITAIITTYERMNKGYTLEEATKTLGKRLYHKYS